MSGVNKFRNYANLRTSLKGRNAAPKMPEPSSRLSFKPVVDMGKDIYKDLKDAGSAFIDDVKRGYGLDTPNDQAAEYMNGSLTKVVDANQPVDARSMSSEFADVSIGSQNYIAMLENLSMINALPPIPDNIVDPPPIWEKSLIKTDLDSWSSGLIGKDYLQRVIARGQFLTLVPLDITPRLLGNWSEKGADLAKHLNLVGLVGSAKDMILKSLDERLNNASYGLTATVNSLKYYKAVNAHMKAAMLSLGIDYGENATSKEVENLYKYLPSEIVERLMGNASPIIQTIQERFQIGGENSSLQNANVDQQYGPIGFKDGNIGDEVQNPNAFVGTDTTGEAFVRKKNYLNLLKYITNMDENDEAIKTLPFAVFYCNGPIEKGMATSTNLGESAIASMTTDIGNKMFTHAKSATDLSSFGGQSEDYIKEMAYHRNLGSFLVSNTYIPNVIKSSMLDFQYTVNIRDVAVSSDRYSIARIMYTLAQLFPFVIQTNEPGASLVVPSAPMYCAAFSKGVMNVPRAAITNMNIKTSPEFQTTEGIPTELDITITIQPLFNQSTMPNFDKFYDGTNHPEYLAAAMFNPLSSFNIIATMCGQNTILTRFQAGLIEFFLKGSISTFYSSIKNTGTVLASSWRDWWSSADIMRNEVYSRTRIIGI